MDFGLGGSESIGSRLHAPKTFDILTREQQLISSRGIEGKFSNGNHQGWPAASTVLTEFPFSKGLAGSLCSRNRADRFAKMKSNISRFSEGALFQTWTFKFHFPAHRRNLFPVCNYRIEIFLLSTWISHSFSTSAPYKFLKTKGRSFK